MLAVPKDHPYWQAETQPISFPEKHLPCLLYTSYGNERLVIESRFNSNQQDYFIQYMLEKVLDFPNVLKLSTNVNKEKRVLNLLLYLFPYYLKKAMRKGTFKKYTCNEYNDDHIKGTINISRHIKKNTPFIGNI